MKRVEWSMGCQGCGACITVQAAHAADPVVLCEPCDRLFAVRGLRTVDERRGSS